MFESVLLPAPFSPSSACTSPAAASKSTRSFASTPGKRFVIPRMATAGEAPGSPAPLACGLDPGASCPTRLPGGRNVGDRPDDAPDEPLHRVQVLDPQTLALLDHQLALLVVERAGELVEAAVLDRLLLGQDLRLGLGGDLRPERREPCEAVVDRAVVE